MDNLVVFVLAIMLLVFISLIPALLWLSVDEKVAHVFGNPLLATFTLKEAWFISFILSTIFKSNHSCSKE